MGFPFCIIPPKRGTAPNAANPVSTPKSILSPWPNSSPVLDAW